MKLQTNWCSVKKNELLTSFGDHSLQKFQLKQMFYGKSWFQLNTLTSVYLQHLFKQLYYQLSRQFLLLLVKVVTRHSQVKWTVVVRGIAKGHRCLYDPVALLVTCQLQYASRCYPDLSHCVLHHEKNKHGNYTIIPGNKWNLRIRLPSRTSQMA